MIKRKRIGKLDVKAGAVLYASDDKSTVFSTERITDTDIEYILVSPIRKDIYTYIEERGRLSEGFNMAIYDDCIFPGDDNDNNSYRYLAYQYWLVYKKSDSKHKYRKSIHFLYKNRRQDPESSSILEEMPTHKMKKSYRRDLFVYKTFSSEEE